MAKTPLQPGQTAADEHWDKAIRRALRSMRTSNYMVEKIEWNESGYRIVLSLAPGADVRDRWWRRWRSNGDS